MSLWPLPVEDVPTVRKAVGSRAMVWISVSPEAVSLLSPLYTPICTCTGASPATGTRWEMLPISMMLTLLPQSMRVLPFFFPSLFKQCFGLLCLPVFTALCLRVMSLCSSPLVPSQGFPSIIFLFCGIPRPVCAFFFPVWGFPSSSFTQSFYNGDSVSPSHPVVIPVFYPFSIPHSYGQMWEPCI